MLLTLPAALIFDRLCKAEALLKKLGAFEKAAGVRMSIDQVAQLADDLSGTDKPQEPK
jgi:hypothetical protein